MRNRAGIYVLAVVVAINFLNYLDRYLPAAAAPAIQAEFPWALHPPEPATA
jgi:hypothetical protein